jgi:hypothetical protein
MLSGWHIFVEHIDDTVPFWDVFAQPLAPFMETG